MTPRWPTVLQARNAEARGSTARRLSGWASAVGAQPVAEPDELAVLVKALLTGLAMQQRLEPGSVPDELAVRGLTALLGMPRPGDRESNMRRSVPSRRTSAPTNASQSPSIAAAVPTSQGATP